MVELGPWRLVGFDPIGPGDHHQIAGAAEMGGDQLGVMERGVAGPGPSGVVHAVGIGTAQ